MALDDDKKNKKFPDENLDENLDETEGEGGESGSSTGTSGGAGTQVEFRDFISTGVPLRDDLLSPDEKKRLLIVHKNTHEAQVKKQKATRDERKALKNGKISLQSYYHRLQNGAASKYKANPILANKAQFSGVDRQVSALPNDNIAETNQDKREKLEYQYNLRHRPQATQKFIPPKLTRQ